MKQIRKVTGMVLAVMAPFAALSAFALVEMSATAREEIERIIAAKVNACLAATEREAARHGAAALALAAVGTAAPGDLTNLRRHAEAVQQRMKPDWLTVAMSEGSDQVFNLLLPPGEPLRPTLDPEADARALLSSRPVVAGVTVDRTRLPEPFVAIRVGVPGRQPLRYVLIAAVRAWSFNQTLRECGLPAADWRIFLVDANLRIVARTVSEDPLDPFVGAPASDTFRRGLASGQPFFESTALDGMETYVGVATSERTGWIASVSVPVVQVEAAIWRTRLWAGSIAAAGLLAAAVTCWLSIRTYARTATTERLEATIREKDTLLREIHHRVKNNLQAMYGMMMVERVSITDAHARGRIEAIMQRVLVLGRIHQQLYESSNLSQINFAIHLAEMVGTVRETVDPEQITLGLDAEPLCCDLEVALPLGLITYELISNAQKHAFPDGRRGTITVQFERCGDRVHLGVCDDGAGLDPASKPGIGMVLVEALAGQCGGEVEMVYQDGCRANVNLPGDLFQGD